MGAQRLGSNETDGKSRKRECHSRACDSDGDRNQQRGTSKREAKVSEIERREREQKLEKKW